MSDDTTALPSKLYFRIGEVAGLVGVEPHVLRYWEREFRTIRPSKSAKGQRVYSRRDVENLLRVRELLYGQGFTIAGARKRLRDRSTEVEAQVEAAPEAVMEAVTEDRRESSALVHAAIATNGSVSPRMRGQLEELKTEIEAFLEELGR